MIKKKLYTLLLTVVIFIICSLSVFSHNGRIDKTGGHHDYENDSGLGYYHYHHGKPAHLHTGGVCPYDTPKQTLSPAPSISSNHETQKPLISTNDITSNKPDLNASTETNNHVELWFKHFSKSNILFMGLVLLSFLCFYWKCKTNRLNATIEMLNNKIAECNSIQRKMEYTNDILQTNLNFYEEHIAFISGEHSKKYHTIYCHHIQKKETFMAYNVAQAEARGYTPCKECHITKTNKK